MRKITLLLLVSIVAFCLGTVCGAYWFNHSKVLDKACFTTIQDERDFLVEANLVKLKLIRLYGDAVNSKDSVEKELYMHKIDSMYEID